MINQVRYPPFFCILLEKYNPNRDHVQITNYVPCTPHVTEVGEIILISSQRLHAEALQPFLSRMVKRGGAYRWSCENLNDGGAPQSLAKIVRN